MRKHIIDRIWSIILCRFVSDYIIVGYQKSCGLKAQANTNTFDLYRLNFLSKQGPNFQRHFPNLNYEIGKEIPELYKRRYLPVILESEGLHTGAEVGVFRGQFAEWNLEMWPSCTRYLLVDLWEHQENYADVSNVEKSKQDANLKRTIARLERFKDRYEICHNYSTVCAERHKDEVFDFVYIDARHDYKGVLQDLAYWWPLVKKGGIMAGHDFVYQRQGPKKTGQNWTVNYDGTVDHLGRAVRGAVEEFFGMENRTIYVTKWNEDFPTWIVRK